MTGEIEQKPLLLAAIQSIDAISPMQSEAVIAVCALCRSTVLCSENNAVMVEHKSDPAHISSPLLPVMQASRSQQTSAAHTVPRDQSQLGPVLQKHIARCLCRVDAHAICDVQ